jgi:geranylgeranyl pyrophosphate synthase
MRPILAGNLLYDLVSVNESQLNSLLDAASALEMLHVSSLIHDDLPCIDNDSTRWDKPCNHLIFGESSALLAANTLISMSFDIVLSSKCIESQNKISIAQLMSDAFSKLCAGQQLDLLPYDEKLQYLKDSKIDRLKTGSLFGLALSIGAIVSGQNEQCVKKASMVGEEFGILFQLLDDKADNQEVNIDQQNTVTKSIENEVEKFRLEFNSLELTLGKQLSSLSKTIFGYL